MATQYINRPFRMQQKATDTHKGAGIQQYHAPYLHEDCGECRQTLLQELNNSDWENKPDLLVTLGEAYFNDENINPFNLYRHFHPRYAFEQQPYQNEFTPLAVCRRLLINNPGIGDIILVRMILAGKTYQAVITDPTLYSHSDISAYPSNSQRPGYYVRAFANTAGYKNGPVFIRIANPAKVVADNVIILTKRSPDTSLTKTNESFASPVKANRKYDSISDTGYGIEQEDASSAPDLLHRETSPASETLYVSIDLGLRKECMRRQPPAYNCIASLQYDVEPKTGIFIPASFTARTGVDLLIYLHGHKTGYVSHGRDLPIDSFWDISRRPKFAFRELLNSSGKNFILVAPTLGPLSQPGILTSSDGFTNFINKVTAAIGQYSSLYQGQQTPRIRNIVLAAHSGGGDPMRRIARLAGNTFAALIKECWGFDCTYSSRDPSEWYDWANSNPGKSLYLFSISGTSTARNAAGILAGRTPLQNIHLVRSATGDHNSVPQVHMAERLATLSGLAEVYDETEPEDEGCECAESDNFIEDEQSSDLFSEDVPPPIPVTELAMIVQNIPFAPVPAIGSYWPVRTANSVGRLVSYLTVNNTTRGRSGRKFLARRDNRKYNGSISQYRGTRQKPLACRD